MNLRWSFFVLLPFTVSVIAFKYFRGNSAVVRWANRTVFFINVSLHFIANIVFNILAHAYIHGYFDIALIGQSILLLSTFLFATPLRYNVSVSFWEDVVFISGYGALDGLSAVKEIVYQDNVLFLLTSVLGLLVALIGSAVLTRGK